MKSLKFFIIALLFAFMTACDNGDSLDITSVEENKQFSFEVYLESRIIPDSAIVSMYNSSNRLEKTVKTRKKCFAGAKCMFETAPLKYEEYAKITLFAHATTENKTIQMEFERYAPMNTSTSTINVYYGTPVLNIYTAAASKAIEYNLLEKNMSYGDATQNAYDNMKNFGISDREYEKDQYFPNVSSMNPIQRSQDPSFPRSARASLRCPYFTATFSNCKRPSATENGQIRYSASEPPTI